MMFKMLAGMTPSARASPLTVAPAPCAALIAWRCSSLVLAGRPSVLPCAFARSRPHYVRSTNRSRSISATAASIVSINLPAALVRSSLPSWRTTTWMLRSASIDCGADVLSTTAQAVELRYDQGFTVADLAEHLSELRALHRRDLSRDTFVCEPIVDLIAD